MAGDVVKKVRRELQKGLGKLFGIANAAPDWPEHFDDYFRDDNYPHSPAAHRYPRRERREKSLA